MRRRIYVGPFALLLIASAMIVAGYLGTYFQGQTEALRWNIEVKVLCESQLSVRQPIAA